ncbi:uncharacterized protein HGUI_02816 [Hanseniaspora guilliermondii]|uniref:Uncharacterized protein n=1 Tax=Hanseniaspora guilliermondii TaxID=56406 RepID=A0A1L0B2D3_9ASCO|nr:uncharacterized protein HGUI_02816 [Hanseniaspora guilliermondii]
MSYSSKRKRSTASVSIQNFEFSSSDEESEQHSHFIKNTELDETASFEGLNHIDIQSESRNIMNNNIEKVQRPDLSLNSSLIANVTNQLSKSYTQIVNNTSINNITTNKINDSSLQTSLLNSNMSLSKNDKNEKLDVNNNIRILDDLNCVKGRGKLINKTHSLILKNRKKRYVISKKKKMESDNSENNKDCSTSEDDNALNIGQAFELEMKKQRQLQEPETDSQTAKTLNNKNKYKSQKSVLSEILDQNTESKYLDQRQREIVLFSLGQAKEELLSKKLENEKADVSEEETLDNLNKRSINFMQYKEDFDGFVHSEGISNNVQEFVNLLKKDCDFVSFVNIYEREAIEKYTQKLEDIQGPQDKEVIYLKTTFDIDL